MSGLRVDWVAREPPLAPRAVAALGPVARRLAARACDRWVPELAVVAGEDVLVIVGAAEQLPWVDGVSYLGLDPLAPALLLPTALTPTVPTDLLARAVRRRFPGARLALVPHTGGVAVVPVGEAREATPQDLARWLGAG